MWSSVSNKDNLISGMFKTALALEEPWQLTHIEYDDQDEAWHLYSTLNAELNSPVRAVEQQARHTTLNVKPGGILTSGTGKPTCTREYRGQVAETAIK